MNLFLIIFFCLMPTWATAKARVLTYGPALIELTGRLELQTFPGPPGYESIQEGDDVERGFYLRLEAPVDVILKGPHPGVENAQVEKNVQIMQLAINAEDDELWNRFRKAGKGRRVKIEGTLFRRFAGHHHSRVLLSVDRMNPLDR